MKTILIYFLLLLSPIGLKAQNICFNTAVYKGDNQLNINNFNQAINEYTKGFTDCNSLTADEKAILTRKIKTAQKKQQNNAAAAKANSGKQQDTQKPAPSKNTNIESQLTKGDEAFSLRDFLTAFNLYKKYEDHLNGEQMDNYGYIFEFLNNDSEKAFYWYGKGAVKRNPSAMYHLGIMYFYGNGTEKSYEDAKEWFDQTRYFEVYDGLYYLGLIYENGYGVPVDKAFAKYNFQLGCNKGVENCCDRMQDYLDTVGSGYLFNNQKKTYYFNADWMTDGFYDESNYTYKRIVSKEGENLIIEDYYKNDTLRSRFVVDRYDLSCGGIPTSCGAKNGTLKFYNELGSLTDSQILTDGELHDE